MTEEQLRAAEEQGVLADRVGDGTLLQIFTGAIGDRPTFFFELIQRLGCLHPVASDTAAAASTATDVPRTAHKIEAQSLPPGSAGSGLETPGTPPESWTEGVRLVQQPGCGGFGNGNIKELYASMEEYDARLKL